MYIVWINRKFDYKCGAVKVILSGGPVFFLKEI